MRIQLQMAVLAVVLGAACVEPALAQINLGLAFPNLRFADQVDLQHPGDGSNRLFAVRRKGLIKVFDNDPAVNSAQVFLDIRSRVTKDKHAGLLGLAFHPDFANNGFFYVYYATVSNPQHLVVARYQVDSANPNRGDPDSEVILLTVPHGSGFHWGGQIAFGPDEFLYIALGDGSAGDDRKENGQNPETLLGSILRIDVDRVSSVPPDCGAGPNATYTIPVDNPLADGPGNNCDEIWAYGFRNPWRFSFDTATGMLWVADVGEHGYEEIDVVEPGGNYGWNTMEGFHCFDPSTGCDQTGLDLPVWEYAHEHGGAVIGGFVYRGPNVPELTGKYVYADFHGLIWALEYDGQTATNTLLLDTNLNISSFGVDENDELYLLVHAGNITRFTTNMPTITLKRVFRKPDGTKKAVITWNPIAFFTGNIDFYIDRAPNGNSDKRTVNDGRHKLTIPLPGDGPFDIQACNKNRTTACSNIVTADFTDAIVSDEPDDDAAYASVRERGEDRAPAVLTERREAFALYSNYPNPFNPSTEIRFDLPEPSAVRLVVYDVMGREVTRLVYQPMDAGTHSVTWDASGLPSGLYLYRLTAGSFVEMRKMVLVQ